MRCNLFVQRRQAYADIISYLLALQPAGTSASVPELVSFGAVSYVNGTASIRDRSNCYRFEFGVESSGLLVSRDFGLN